MALCYQIFYELHAGVRLVSRYHVTSLRHYYCCKVFVVTVPATDFLRTIKLVVVLINLPRLEIKHFATIEVNLFDPLECPSHTVLHVVIADIDKDTKSARQKLGINEGCIVFAVYNRTSHCTVCAYKLIRLLYMQSVF